MCWNKSLICGGFTSKPLCDILMKSCQVLHATFSCLVGWAMLVTHRGPTAKYVGTHNFLAHLCVLYPVFYGCNDTCTGNCTEHSRNKGHGLPHAVATTHLDLSEHFSLFCITLMPPARPLSTGSRPTVQYLSSLCELPQALQPYYTQGYVLATLHPIILSVGRTRSLACSLLYRAILARPRPRWDINHMPPSVRLNSF